MIVLSPKKRRLLYVSVFEFFAVIFSTIVLMLLSGGAALQSLPVAIIVSSVAVVWNYIYNASFETIELRRKIFERTLKVRIIHASGFEAGLFLFCLPLYMLWYKVGLWQAVTMESALLLFFLFYTFIFTFAFDKVFMLPHQQALVKEASAPL